MIAPCMNQKSYFISKDTTGDFCGGLKCNFTVCFNTTFIYDFILITKFFFFEIEVDPECPDKFINVEVVFKTNSSSFSDSFKIFSNGQQVFDLYPQYTFTQAFVYLPSDVVNIFEVITSYSMKRGENLMIWLSTTSDSRFPFFTEHF